MHRRILPILERMSRSEQTAPRPSPNMVLPKGEIKMLILLILLVLVFGGGGGYYGYSRWGGGGGLGIVGTVLIIALVLYLVGGIR